MISSLARSPRTLGVLVLLAGCAQATGSGISGGGGSVGSGGSGGPGGSDAGVPPHYDPCSLSMPCSPGKTCVDGLCAAGCNSDADCPTDQYCGLTNGQVCQPKVLVACPATPCAPTQVCVQGLCGTEPTGNPCGPNPFGGGDGCPPDSLCLGNVVVDGKLQSGAVCYSLPHCSAAHPCSPGAAGAVCTAGIVMGKNDMCIPGGCVTDQNCPTGWHCVPPVGTSGYGRCTNGAAGQACGKTSDCQPPLMCHIPVMTMPGTCM